MSKLLENSAPVRKFKISLDITIGSTRKPLAKTQRREKLPSSTSEEVILDISVVPTHDIPGAAKEAPRKFAFRAFGISLENAEWTESLYRTRVLDHLRLFVVRDVTEYATSLFQESLGYDSEP